MGGDCLGGSCQGGNYLGAIVWGIKVQGNCPGGNFMGAIVRGTVVIEPLKVFFEISKFCRFHFTCYIFFSSNSTLLIIATMLKTFFKEFNSKNSEEDQLYHRL